MASESVAKKTVLFGRSSTRWSASRSVLMQSRLACGIALSPHASPMRTCSPTSKRAVSVPLLKFKASADMSSLQGKGNPFSAGLCSRRLASCPAGRTRYVLRTDHHHSIPCVRNFTGTCLRYAP
eukprot:scaffold23417_cov71-Phaeocystis_antarctica.AAC.6